MTSNNKEKKNRLIEFIGVVCLFYTIISLVNAGYAINRGSNTVSSYNQVQILIWTIIGAGIMYMHKLFSWLSPLVMIIVQYIVALGAILLFILILSNFEEVHPNGYRDAFRSFTIPYVCGGIFYYYQVFQDAKKQNKWVQEIKKGK